MIITNPDGRSDIASGVYPAGTPTPTPSPPEIFSFSPSSGPFDEDIPLTITGENFIPQDIKVQLQRVNGGETFDLEVESATSSSVRAIIEANTLTPDNYFVIVINRDSGTDIADNKYIATN